MEAVPASLTLVDGAESIVIRPERATAGDPIICKQWDLGSPDVRAVSADRPGTDGTVDSSGYTGARTVTMDLVIRGDATNSAYAFAERLASLTHPYRRPQLKITRASPEARGQTWSIELRGNPYSLAYGQRAAALLEMQLSFNAPLGYLEGDYQGYDTAVAGSVLADPGFTFRTAFPANFGFTSNTNPVIGFTVGGSAPVSPLVYLFGPVTNPAVTDEAGNTFAFDGLSLADGENIQIDMGAGTILRTGFADPAVFDAVDWSVSSFWRWWPGAHTLRYTATSGRASVYWRDRRYTI
jgi:hypothetical protein